MAKVKISIDIEEIVPSYLEKCKNQIPNLKEDMAQKEYKELKKKTHAMKGVLGSMEFQGAYEILVKIEEDLKTEDYDKVNEGIKEFEKYLEELEIEYVEEEF